MKALLMAAIVAAPLATHPAAAQTPGSATGQQDVAGLAIPVAGCVGPAGFNPQPLAKTARNEPAAAKATESPMIQPGIDPATIEAMYPEPVRDRPQQPR